MFKLLYFQCKKMTTEIKYTIANNSKYAKEPKQATAVSAGHDFLAA